MKSLYQVSPWSINYPLLPGTRSCRSTLTLREGSYGAILPYAKIMQQLYIKHWVQQKSTNTVHSVSAGREGILYINLLPPKATAFSGISGTLNRYFRAQDRQASTSPTMPAHFATSSLHLPGQAGMMRSARSFGTGQQLRHTVDDLQHPHV